MPEIISSSRRPEAPKEVRERLDDAHRPQGLTIIKAPNPFKTIKTVTSTLPQKRHISGESSQDGRIRGLGSLQVGRPLNRRRSRIFEAGASPFPHPLSGTSC